VDELAVLLRGLSEYKRGGGGDRGRLLGLWPGAPWNYTRVGSSGKKDNAVNLRIPRPTLVLCGGLQPHLHELLGGEEDGLRLRFLPHLATLPDEDGLGSNASPTAWQLLPARDLAPKRRAARTWRFDNQAREAFTAYRSAWKQQARGAETATTAAALVKADVHLARVALVLTEAEHPAAGGMIGARGRYGVPPRSFTSP
jgi:Protein of unknown function (DUF3987)